MWKRIINALDKIPMSLIWLLAIVFAALTVHEAIKQHDHTDMCLSNLAAQDTSVQAQGDRDPDWLTIDMEPVGIDEVLIFTFDGEGPWTVETLSERFQKLHRRHIENGMAMVDKEVEWLKNSVPTAPDWLIDGIRNAAYQLYMITCERMLKEGKEWYLDLKGTQQLNAVFSVERATGMWVNYTDNLDTKLQDMHAAK
jgi:hypothetical protein